MINCPACGHANTTDATFCTECGKPLPVKDDIGTINTPNPNATRHPGPGPEMPELAAGTLFDKRYTIVEKIGQGGMGTVYKATEKLGSLDRTVALKLIRADRLADSAAIDRLMHEGVLTQDIKHDNIVTVYNVGVAAEAPYVAMEFVDGHSLRTWLRRQQFEDTKKDPPPMAVVATLIRSILDGLKAAHAKGVIHRDLKPENVILLADPTAEAAPLKILDFGIARAPGKSEALTGTGTGMGTAHYMAPEQETNPAGANPATDLYALSRMFYELLMGVLPRGAVQSISGGRGDVPPAIDALIARGLDDAQRARPQSADEYREALDKALAGGKGGSLFPPRDPQNPVDDDQKPKSRKMWYWAGGTVLALAALSNVDWDTPNPPPPQQGPGPGQVVEDTTGGANFSILGGYWNVSDNSAMQVTVDPDGEFSGAGVLFTGVQFSIYGNLAAGTFQIDYGGGPVPGVVQAGSNACHLQFQTLYPDGNPWQNVFHIDHPPVPNTPCPDRFAGM